MNLFLYDRKESSSIPACLTRLDARVPGQAEACGTCLIPHLMIPKELICDGVWNPADLGGSQEGSDPSG